MTPLIILAGSAGAGKDTAASYLVNRYGGVAVGQADVLKHMARDFFGFTDQQLFGPSECRNELDDRFALDVATPDSWMDEAASRIGAVAWGQVNQADKPCAGYRWAQRVFPDRAGAAHQALIKWFNDIIVPRARQDGGLTARFVLQTLGTEYGRILEKDVWGRYSREIALKLLSGDVAYSREHGLTEVPGQPAYPVVIITDGRFSSEIIGVKTIGGVAVNIVRNANMRGAAEAAGVKGHASEAELDGVPPHFYDHRLNNNHDIPGLQQQIDAMVLKFWDGKLKPIQRFA